MWKKRILCLVLVLCSILVLSSCQKKETFMTLDQQQQLQQQQQQTASQSSDAQNLFGETALPQQNTIDDFDSGDYDPAAEEGWGEVEDIYEQPVTAASAATPTPPMINAGATPLVIDAADEVFILYFLVDLADDAGDFSVELEEVVNINPDVC